MSFNFPFGLLLLIGIPILIIIYIIKNKYKEKVASSDYIWELSKKFLKKKNPLNSIANLLNLIIQCFCIAFLSFSLADPVFTFTNGAENEVYILDASASMGMENEDGLTRFEKAKNEIKTLVEDAKNGSTFTLVVGDSNARTICKNIQEKEIFVSLLDRVELDYAESGLETAISLAQTLSSQEEGSRFTLFTDKDVKSVDGFFSVNVGDTNKNYAINDLRISDVKEEESTFILLEADVVSFSEDTNLKVEFFFNETSLGTVEKEVKQNKNTTVSLKLPNIDKKYSNYSSLKALVTNEDYLKEDSEFIVYNTNDFDTTKILMVSSSPFYFESAFNALNNNKVKISYRTISPTYFALTSATVGYDLVIFDSYAPDKLPVDSAVWLFNCGESIPNSGFYFQKEITVDDPGINVGYANNNNDLLYKALTKDLIKRDITIKTYLRYTLNSKFTTILSYNNLPFVFAGRNGYNQKQIVFNFDLHNTNYPLLADFIILMRNCISYCNPSILSDFNYSVSENVVFTFPDTALDCQIVTPSNKKEYLSATEIQTYKLKEVGTYSIKVKLATGETKNINIFSSFPKDERVPLIEDKNMYRISISEGAKKADRIFDALLVVVIIALIFLLADWMIYGHEQF